MIVGEQPERTRDTRPVDRIEHRLPKGMIETRVREYLQAHPSEALLAKQLAARIHCKPHWVKRVLDLLHIEGAVVRRMRTRWPRGYAYRLNTQ